MSKRTDRQLRDDILAELDWDPEVDASRIGVAAANGVVRLTGSTRCYSDKWGAERAVKRMQGVGAVANDIEVQLDPDARSGDTKLAHAALSALGWTLGVPLDRIKLAVENGWITLEGTVEWHFQSCAAEEAVRSLRGLRGLSNLIAVVPRVRSAGVKTKIEAALRRNAEIDARNIAVETKGGSVTLRGRVRTWAERDDAISAAWAAPGVSAVVDRITVQP